MYGVKPQHAFNFINNNLAIYANYPNFEIWIRLRDQEELCELKLDIKLPYSPSNHLKLKDLWEQLQWE